VLDGSSTLLRSLGEVSLKAFDEEHPNARLIIVSLDVTPRTFNNVEVMPAPYFLHELWKHKIY
jgi:hypothetical protein